MCFVNVSITGFVVVLVTVLVNVGKSILEFRR